LKQGITETDINNFTKALTFFQSKYIFESEPQSSFQIDNGDAISIKDTIISVKSLIPKDENGYVDAVVKKESQLAYPGKKDIQYITDGYFVGKYLIRRNSLALKKITYNKKGEIKETLVYPSFSSSEGYFKYILTDNQNGIEKRCNVYAQRLFGMIFNGNDDIFRKLDCDSIDRNRCNNRPVNLRWVTSQENQCNKGQCSTKIDRKHDIIDIYYLKELAVLVKLIISNLEKQKKAQRK
jgi:hypothetical protein